MDEAAWERQEKWRRDGDGDGGGSAVNQQQKRPNSRSGATVGEPVSFQRSGDVLEHNPILWLQALSGRATCGRSCVYLTCRRYLLFTRRSHFTQPARGTRPSGEAGQRADEEAGYGHRRIGLWPQDRRMRTDGAAATRLTAGGGDASQDGRMQLLPLDGRMGLRP